MEKTQLCSTCGTPQHDDPMVRLILLVVRACVDNEDQVQVEVASTPSTTTVEVRVAADDGGHALGKGGATAQAFRTILNTAAKKYRRTYHLHVEVGGHRYQLDSQEVSGGRRS